MNAKVEIVDWLELWNSTRQFSLREIGDALLRRGLPCLDTSLARRCSELAMAKILVSGYRKEKKYKEWSLSLAFQEFLRRRKPSPKISLATLHVFCAIEGGTWRH